MRLIDKIFPPLTRKPVDTKEPSLAEMERWWRAKRSYEIPHEEAIEKLKQRLVKDPQTDFDIGKNVGILICLEVME
jgi:hypothetical protein